SDAINACARSMARATPSSFGCSISIRDGSTSDVADDVFFELPLPLAANAMIAIKATTPPPAIISVRLDSGNPLPGSRGAGDGRVGGTLIERSGAPPSPEGADGTRGAGPVVPAPGTSGAGPVVPAPGTSGAGPVENCGGGTYGAACGNGGS